MLLEYFRLSLLERAQQDVFERQINGRRPTREETIRAVFSERFEFYHRKTLLIYVPDPAASDEIYKVGRIGRRKTSKDHEPPEKGMHERFVETWQASLVIVDPRDHTDGQKVAAERDTAVGQPYALLSSFIEALNSREVKESYEIHVNPISDPVGFWDYIEENEGSIVSIELDVTTPNMFRSRSDFNDEMKEFRDNEKAREVQIKLENKDGLNPKTKRMQDAVDYTLSGGGVAKAKAKGKRKYNSKNKTKRVEVPEPEEKQTVIQRIRSAVTRAFS